MIRVVVIDADPAMAGLPVSLHYQGIEGVFADGATQGLGLLSAERSDLVVVAWSLPDGSGADLCRTIKRCRTTALIPVIFVAAHHVEADAVLAFELGASDYVARPVSHRELALRIRAVLRRNQLKAAPPRASLQVGALRVDRAAHRFWVDGAEVQVTPASFRLLIALLDHSGEVQTRAALKKAWEGHVTDRTVDTTILRLRASLGPVGADIETVRGVGYRFRREGG